MVLCDNKYSQVSGQKNYIYSQVYFLTEQMNKKNFILLTENSDKKLLRYEFNICKLNN